MNGIRIYDSFGNLKKETPDQGQSIYVALGGFQSGIYLLKTVVNGQLWTKPFVISQ